MQLNISCMKPSIELHANGKLLISGEYLVLAGARALALPVRFGQRMTVSESSGNFVEWESTAPGGRWFYATFDPGSLAIVSSGDDEVAGRLQTLLLAARSLNPEFLTGQAGLKISVEANYPVEWGLGSSSTLISLVAGFAGVDAYQLFRMISGGSGYDIACARRQGLLYYSLINGIPDISDASAGKALREYAWFTYLGTKQDSSREVDAFRAKKNYSAATLEEVSRLSADICEAASAEELIGFVDRHERLVSAVLNREPIAGRFQSFPGTVKSLGAWGGDFAMFVSAEEPEVVKGHLHRFGFTNIFRYNELAITP